MQPFRFGVNARRAKSRAEWQETARKIEGLGYTTLTLPDHLTDMIAPMPALVSAAEATTTLRVGTNVLNNDLRHPVLVAREAAAVDLLTDGRLQLGLGAGSIQAEYEQAGLGFDRGRTRVERLAEAVTIMKGLLKGEKITFAGRHYHVTGHAIAPLPVQRPHPPILIGGNGAHLPRPRRTGSRYRRFLGDNVSARRRGTVRPVRMEGIEPRRAGAAGARDGGR
jgi:probable F420-dependent oxidoreductase